MTVQLEAISDFLWDNQKKTDRRTRRDACIESRYRDIEISHR